MFCNFCGAEAPDGSLYCNRCGREMAPEFKRVFSIKPTVTVIPEKSARTTKRRIGKRILAIILTVAAMWILIVAVGNIVMSLKRQRTYYGPQGITPTSIFTPVLRTQTITRGAYSLSAGQLGYFPIHVPSGAQNPVVTGRFTAAGGAYNDVYVYVVDEDGLTNLKNRNAANTYYNSDRATVGQINARLPPGNGTYYIVVSNMGAIFMSKSYTIDATMQYYE